MKFINVAIAAIPVTFAAELGSFSYKPDSDKAPNAWGSLDLGPTVKNQCGGSSQSGIDVPTSTCDISGDYVFAVRPQAIVSVVIAYPDAKQLKRITNITVKLCFCFSAWILHP
jgi:hypothetical protein